MPAPTLRTRMALLYGTVICASAVALVLAVFGITRAVAPGLISRRQYRGSALSPPGAIPGGHPPGTFSIAFGPSVVVAALAAVTIVAVVSMALNFIANASHELRTPLSAGRALLQVTIADPEPGPAPATADPSLAESLIANLIDNAIRHNIPGGQVTISTAMTSAGAAITVGNTGTLIPPDAVEHLFQPFRQLGTQRIRHNGGTRARSGHHPGDRRRPRCRAERQPSPPGRPGYRGDFSVTLSAWAVLLSGPGSRTSRGRRAPR